MHEFRCKMRVVPYLLGVLLVIVGAHACCNTFEETKEAVKNCSNGKSKYAKGVTSNEVCPLFFCIAKELKTLKDGKLDKAMSDKFIEKVFPKASEKLKTQVMSCVDKGNVETDECKVLLKTFACLNAIDGLEGQEMLDLLHGRDNKQLI